MSASQNRGEIWPHPSSWSDRSKVPTEVLQIKLLLLFSGVASPGLPPQAGVSVFMAHDTIMIKMLPSYREAPGREIKERERGGGNRRGGIRGRTGAQQRDRQFSIAASLLGSGAGALADLSPRRSDEEDSNAGPFPPFFHLKLTILTS